MAFVVTYSPLLPLPGDSVSLNVTTQDGTVAEWTLQAVPSGSKQAAGRLANYASTFTGDQPGAYLIAANDWQLNYTPPKFSGDPNAIKTLTLRNTATQTVYVAKPLSRTIGAGSDKVDLVLFLQNDQAAGAMLTSPRTKAAEVASRDAGVLEALYKCIGIASASLDDTLAVKVNNARQNYEAHRVLTAGSVHLAADTVNAVTRNRDTSTNEGAIAAVNDIRVNLAPHMLSVIAHTKPDATDVLVAGTAIDVQSAHALLDNWWGVYESHRALVGSPLVHGAADATNVLATQKPLANLQRAFIVAALNASLGVPSGEQSAVVKLVTAHGFKG